MMVYVLLQRSFFLSDMNDVLAEKCRIPNNFCDENRTFYYKTEYLHSGLILSLFSPFTFVAPQLSNSLTANVF